MQPQPNPQQSPQQQLPPINGQNLAMFAQMMAQKYGISPANLTQGGQPPMPPQGAPQPGQHPPPPQGAAPGGAPPGGGMSPPPGAGAPPQGQPPPPPPQQGMPPGQPPQGGPPPQQPPALMPQPGSQETAQGGGPQHKFTPQEMAALGRYGDSTIAHLTPGEIAVPPQVQSPKVLATLKQAFKDKHVPAQNFVAGSPSSSINPSTGAPEYSFWSSFLPIALGAAGTMIAPGVGTALGSSLGAGAMAGIGGAAGSGIGNLVAGNGMTQSLIGAAAGGAGGYFGAGAGGLGGAGGDAGGGGAAGGQTADQAAQAAQQAGFNMGPQTGGMTLPTGMSDTGGGLLSNIAANASPKAGLMAGGAAGLAGSLFPSQKPGQVNGLPANFSTPYTPASQLPSYQQQLGQTGYSGPQAQFTNYNPFTNSPAAYNFFPTQVGGATS